MTFEELQQKIELAYQASAARWSARLAKISDKIAAQNEGLQPTLDEDGRLHAPCDGYYYEDEDISGEYLAGEYLPIPFDPDLNQRQTVGAPSIKVSHCDPERIDLIAKEYRISSGTKFQLEGTTVCHAYLTPTRCAEVDRLIAEYLQAPINDLVAQKEKARAAEKEAAAPAPVTDERIEITGEVVASKIVEGYYGCTLKVMIKTVDGWTAWGTCPKSIDGERGDKVSFFAKVEPAKDDAKHCFFSRPTKAKVLEQAPA